MIKLGPLIVSLGLAHVHPDVVLGRIILPNLNIKVLSFDLVRLVLALIATSTMNFGGRYRSRRYYQKTILVILLVISSMLPIIKVLLVRTLVIVMSLLAMWNIRVTLILIPPLSSGQSMLIPLGILVVLLVVGTLLNRIG